jgi:hypothetical protein
MPHIIQSKDVWNKVVLMTPCPSQPIPRPLTGRHPLDRKFKRVIKRYKLLCTSVK